MKIDKELFIKVAEEAKASPHLRMNYDLRNDENEQSQRMLNVLLPGTSRLYIDIREQVRQ